MNNKNLFLCFVLALVISVVLAGCSSASGENAGKNDTGKTDSQAWNDPSKPEDQTWGDPENYESQSWSDPENYDDQDWRDPENPGTEAADPGESDHAGMYRHEIDGIVFYTEHDVAQWIGHQDGLGMTFNLEQMAKDIFGDEGTESWDGIVMLPVAPSTFEFDNADMSGSTYLQAKNGVYPFIVTGQVIVYDMGYGDGSEYYKPYYFINGSYHCTDYEMIEIALYAFEKWANGERYQFENFSSSTRFMVIVH
ncbi:MAG: hypothetical protein II047_13025 [Bacteroidales bacterium]|nr:hypothetical protein [Bacteroidales bacterium]